MKKIILSISIATVLLAACNADNKKSSEENKNTDTTTTSGNTLNKDESVTSSMKEMVTQYLQIKNALSSDNDKEAAAAGKQMTEALKQTDKASMTPEQKKVYDEVKDDIQEHAEHISANAGKIEHQREHFDMISKDMYDLVKVIKPNQTLYVDHCPMYNDNKGASWLSETKEIKNPYLGKKMPTCGTIKEEIK